MFRMPLRRFVVRTAVAALAVAAPVALTPIPASAAEPTADLFFSEYVEGSSLNKAIEIYNGTDAAVDLGAGGYRLELYSNGAATASQTVSLSGTIARGDVFVAANGGASAEIQAQTDLTTNAVANWNGDDAVVLRKGSAVLDVIGQVGFRPSPEWGSGTTSTADNTLVKKDDVCTGDTDPTDVFDPSVAWNGFAQNTVDNLGTYTGDCGTGAGGGGDGGGDPTPECADTWTPTYDIQGEGARTPIYGQQVTTHGVVVGDYEGGASGGIDGFFIQDSVGDGDPATSDGLFVYNPGRDDVAVGDVVQVTGYVSEYFDQTQVSAGEIVACDSDETVSPTVIELPRTDASDYEQYEGMLVRYDQTLYVTELFQLGRFGQVTVSSGDRLHQPTNLVEPGPEANALQAENDLNRVIIDDATNRQNPDPIIWGRGGRPLSAENTLRGGDTVTGATGVLNWTWAGNGASGNAWRLRPSTPDGAGITFEPANPRPTSAPDVGGSVHVAGMNLLNYFNTLDRNNGDDCNGGVGASRPMECRGAETALELERQTAKTVAAIAALGADVIGVNEIENDGYGPESALATLVDAVNAELGAGTYAYVDVDAETGEVDALGTDAIKVGFLYKPAAVSPVGDTAVLNTDSFVTGGDASPRNRPSLAQAWQSTATGGVFTVDVNHLKSKGSACETPDTGDGQGNCAVVRTRAVRELLEWLATDPTHVDDSDVLLVGDYNSYAKEDPIRTLEAGGFTNLVEEYQGEDAYSYVFDGQWGYLDQAMASLSMATQVTGAADFHINADEPSVLDYNTNFKSAGQRASLYAPDMYRVSDHDPVLIGIDPAPSVYRTPVLDGPLAKPGRTVKAGSTVPVKALYALSDGSTPTDVGAVVEVRLGDEVVGTYEMSYVDGYWQDNLRTGDLPDQDATYRVTVIAPGNGQSVTTTLTLR